MAVDGMGTFLKGRGLASLGWVATVVAGGAIVACSSDPASSESSQSNTGSTSGSGTTQSTTTAPGTTGTTTGGIGNTTSGPGGVTTTGGGGASSTTSTVGGPTTAGPNTGGPSTSGGGASTTGTATTGPSGDCGLTVDSYDLSEAISTVGIVEWSANGTVSSAEIQFGPAGGNFTMTAPVDLNEPNYRTLLLGMKPESEYQFQIVAQVGGQSCTSETLSLSTGPVSNFVPNITKSGQGGLPGFYVTVEYGAQNSQAFIFDSDGDPVWWTSAPPNSSGVRIDYEGKAMWIVTGNPTASGQGQVRRVSMDGTNVQNLPSTYDAHHDLAPLPGGSVAALIHANGNCASIIEVHADMTVTDIVPDVSTIYTPVQQCHPNAILYHPPDDSFTVSDRNPNLYVKIKRSGEVEWQLGGNNPLGPHIQKSWSVNHGHHLLPNGNFLFYNNNGDGGGMGGPGSANASPVVEFALDVQALTADEVWRYVDDKGSGSLGDVQRLSNGNTLITYSNSGWVYEVNQAKEIVQTFKTDPLGYLMHRESLYGPPPK